MKKIFTFIVAFWAFTSFAQIRISQVYGSGGNTAVSSYTNDFVEIFNAGAASVDISGWSIQYASAAGPTAPANWVVAAIPAATTLGAGKYFLIMMASGGANGMALPTPDFTFTTIQIGGAAGKVALVNNSTALNSPTACSAASVVDVLGYGATATCSETGYFPTTGITNAQSIQRGSNGCTDANNNATDFAIGTVAPRNSGTATNLCAGGPAINAGPTVSALTTTAAVASASKPFNVSGSSLTGFPGNLTVTASSTDFQVSLSMGSGYASSVNIPYTAATLAAVTVYVRISASAALGAVASTIKVNGGGASEGIVNVSGNVVSANPSMQASAVVLSNVTNSGLDINWTNGNGSSRIAVIRQTTTTDVPPTDGATYTAAASIATAGITGSGNFVVYSAMGMGPVTVTGLTAGTNYTVTVYEFNGSAGSNNYLTPGVTATASTTGISPNLTQANFTAIAAPLYTGSGSTSRTPTMFYAKLSNLAPNTTYRYYTQAAISTDFNTTNLGAGSGIMVDYTVSPVTYTYASTNSLSAAGGYAKFTTDAAGNFSGSFGFVNTGNARFTAGNLVFPTIALSADPLTTILYRFALDQSMTVLGFATTSTANDGTFIQGKSLAMAGNLVALWNNITATGRPLSMTIAEHPTFLGTPWGPSFVAGYDSLTAGSWNTIIPNTNASGVRLIEQFNIVTGTAIGCDSDADGTWPTGPVVTSTPTGGSTSPLQLSATDAPLNAGTCFNVLPIKLDYITGKKTNAGNAINWKVTCTSTNITMEIERASGARDFKSIFTIAATQARCNQAFDFNDAQPLKGNNYYRLKLIDIDGKISYSPIVLLINATKGFEVVGLFPTVVKYQTTLSVSSATTTMLQTNVTDLSGKLLISNKQTIPSGSSLISIDCGKLAPGLYNLTGIAADATKKTIRFVKL